MHFTIERRMVAGLVGGTELPIVIVDLPRGSEIARGVNLKRKWLVCMRVLREPFPVFRMEARWIRCQRRRGIDGLIAGKNSAMQEAIA